MIFAADPDVAVAAVEVGRIADFYAKNLRAPLFGGFLATASFLLSATTFMILHLKREVVDTDFHRKRIQKAKEFSTARKIYHTAPLRNVLRALLGTVAIALAAAAFQMTLGLCETTWAAVICLIVASLAFIALCASLGLIWLTLSDMINFWEQIEIDKEKANHTAPNTGGS